MFFTFKTITYSGFQIIHKYNIIPVSKHISKLSNGLSEYFQCNLKTPGQPVLCDDAEGNLYLARVNSMGGIHWGKTPLCKFGDQKIPPQALVIGNEVMDDPDVERIATGLSLQHFSFKNNKLQLNESIDFNAVVKYALAKYSSS